MSDGQKAEVRGRNLLQSGLKSPVFPTPGSSLDTDATLPGLCPVL